VLLTRRSAADAAGGSHRPHDVRVRRAHETDARDVGIRHAIGGEKGVGESRASDAARVEEGAVDIKE
jgi:hypothetical protein